MKKLLSGFILFFLLINTLSSKATEYPGCYIDSYGILYPNADGGTYNGDPTYNGTGGIFVDEPAQLTSTSNGCYLKQGRTTFTYIPGVLSTYNDEPVSNVPLDDYAWILFIVTASFGIYRLRKLT